jgi:hypothetical protein
MPEFTPNYLILNNSPSKKPQKFRADSTDIMAVNCRAVISDASSSGKPYREALPA